MPTLLRKKYVDLQEKMDHMQLANDSKFNHITDVLRCVYRVVSYKLCNHIIVRPFKGDEYYDGIHYGDPTSLITSTTR